MKFHGISSACALVRWLALLALGAFCELAAAQTAGTIQFLPVKGVYTATANYLATSGWIPDAVYGAPTPVLATTMVMPHK